jgi:hypothetical protein
MQAPSFSSSVRRVNCVLVERDSLAAQFSRDGPTNKCASVGVFPRARLIQRPQKASIQP